MAKPALKTARTGTVHDGRGGARAAARLLAVQALYQIEMMGAAPEAVIAEFEHYRFSDLAAIDQPFFVAIVGDACARQAKIDASISDALAADWPLHRLERVLLAIIRCGVCELSTRRDIPPRVTISEYVAIAHGFLDGKGPAMVNAVLDRLARTLRADELNAAADPAS